MSVSLTRGLGGLVSVLGTKMGGRGGRECCLGVPVVGEEIIGEIFC